MLVWFVQLSQRRLLVYGDTTERKLNVSHLVLIIIGLICISLSHQENNNEILKRA